MPSEKFRIATNGQSLRNPNNAFFGMTLTANLTVDESDVSAHNDRRSAHNALERQRREDLNIKFQKLAHALPSLQSVRRPSKTMIVAKSLEFVSSSLKRESSFASEIQRLRAENEKLRLQAQAQSSLLKKQVSEEEINTCSETIKVEANETTKSEVKEATLKRKASEIDQLSPPPTPEAMRADKQSPVTTPQKKRMVKQTKPLQSQLQPSSSVADTMMTANRMVTPMIESPWSPVDDHFRQPSNAYSAVTNQSNSNYINIDTSPYATHINSPNNDLLFMPTSQAYESNTPAAVPVRPQEYQTMMNSVLFAPYYLSSESPNNCK
ncbi:hypothetical protein BD560DRAFT_380207 [Blakeslea trispora]|nr:hypothetical protein BD560DRAFT_380207 [Blakeslea trispora]